MSILYALVLIAGQPADAKSLAPTQSPPATAAIQAPAEKQAPPEAPTEKQEPVQAPTEKQAPPADGKRAESAAVPINANAALLHDLHAAHRVRHGLRPQLLDAALCRLAQRWAERMASSNSMYHSGWGYSENVAVMGSPHATMRAWIDSGGHNANLLSGHARVGFGWSGGYACSLHADQAGDESVSLAVATESVQSTGFGRRHRGGIRLVNRLVVRLRSRR